MSHSFPRTLAVVAIAALALTGCTDNDPEATASPSPMASPASAFPVTVAADNGDVTLESRPERIVSLSPTATEMLYAIGAGDRVVAVDPFSYYPPETPVEEALSTFPEPSIEAIAGFQPDLVIFATETGELTTGLAAVGITAAQFDAVDDFDGIYAQLEQIGALTGQLAEAAAVVADMQTDLAAVLAAVPDGTEGLTYFHELDDTFYTVTSKTFVGYIYGLLGLVNIGDAAGAAAGSQYPKMSEETILETNPDLVFLADANCCQVTVADVVARDGWGELTASTTGGVIIVDEDLASRWGPRIIDFMREVVTAVAARTPAAA